MWLGPADLLTTAFYCPTNFSKNDATRLGGAKSVDLYMYLAILHRIYVRPLALSLYDYCRSVIITFRNFVYIGYTVVSSLY
jgi:hypothetical protein